MSEYVGRKAKWIGDSGVLRIGAEVTVLAVDQDTIPDGEAQRACWVRHWPEGRDYPKYRSCDLADLDFGE